MALDDFIDLDFVHNALGLSDETKFDEIIANVLLPYTYMTFSQLGITETDLTNYTEQQIANIQMVVAVNLGCFLVKTDPEFGQKYNVWKVGNVSKGYLRRIKTDVDTWCDYYSELLIYVDNDLGITRSGTAKRPGLYDDYPIPY
jgi:hypothetical protein